jgi:2-succinyl-6-hydroxy-2,4-cyclohexadiene-1-carboxylate synthase
MTSQSVTASDLTYHLEIDGEGEPLVMLHGFTGSSASWQGVADALAARRRLIRVDLPGHGRTPAPNDARCRFTRVVEDIALIIEQAAGAPAHVLGYSMGGRLALAVALAHPDHVRTLTLESASPGLHSEEARAERRLADALLADRIIDGGIAAFVDEWERMPLFASQARLPEVVRAQQRALRLANDPLGLARSLRGLSTGAQPSLWLRLADVRPPTLLVSGAEDARYTQIAAQMAAAIPAARHHVIAGAGHTPHLESPAAFLAAVGG